MAWCFSTRASVATVLTTHPCVSRCLRVNIWDADSARSVKVMSFWGLFITIFTGNVKRAVSSGASGANNGISVLEKNLYQSFIWFISSSVLDDDVIARGRFLHYWLCPSVVSSWKWPVLRIMIFWCQPKTRYWIICRFDSDVKRRALMWHHCNDLNLTRYLRSLHVTKLLRKKMKKKSPFFFKAPYFN